jgi:hypothetical protein
MGISIKRTDKRSNIPVWQGQGKDIQLAQGGFLLTTTGLVDGSILAAGTPLVIDEAARTAVALHVGVAYATAGGTDTDYQVTKGHTLQVGDYLASGAVGGKAYAITAIDTSNDGYDVITVGTTIGAVSEGALVYASTATGATASALPAINARSYDEVRVESGGTISAVIRGTVYARRVPTSAAIEAALKTNGAYIIHSLSK